MAGDGIGRGWLITGPGGRWKIEVLLSGRRGRALCPFHLEYTPSLTLEPVSGQWHCFGCGWDGDSAAFVAAMNAAADEADAVVGKARNGNG